MLEPQPLTEVLEQDGVQSLLLKLVNLIDEGYDNAGDNFRKDVGSDARTFGLDVYTFSWFQLRESKLLEITAQEPYWFNLVGASVACHRVGSNFKRGIEASFPRDRKGWPPTVCRQLDMFGTPGELTLSNTLVLAHVGDQNTGLLAVHLCRPLVDQDGYLERWIETRCLWKAGQPAQEIGSSASIVATDKPKEERKPKPQVKLKKRDKDKDASE